VDRVEAESDGEFVFSLRPEAVSLMKFSHLVMGIRIFIIELDLFLDSQPCLAYGGWRLIPIAGRTAANQDCAEQKSEADKISFSEHFFASDKN
jgi:hypothetical protein